MKTLNEKMKQEKNRKRIIELDAQFHDLLNKSTENEALTGLKIYPNPVNNLFYIESNGESQITQIESYNALGQKVRTPYSCQNTLCTINAEQWVAGNYQLMVKTEAGLKVLKIVKL